MALSTACSSGRGVPSRWPSALPSPGPAGPILAVGQVLGLLLLLVVLFVASFTGYLGPSHGPSDALSVTRFRVLHYGLWPSVSIALVAGWYHEPGADRGRGSRSHDAILTEG